MKKAFTMIELIFVIVILGILAAIAVPKIGGVREKAELVKASTNFVTAINDMVINASLNNGVLTQDDGKNAATSPQDVTNAISRDGKYAIAVGSDVCVKFAISSDATKAEVVVPKVDSGTEFAGKCGAFFKENAVADIFVTPLTAAVSTGDRHCAIDLLTGRVDTCQGTSTVGA